MAFTATVLGGASGGVPIGSGVLLQSPSGRRLLDCGNGIVGALHARAALDVVDVALTHLHADHVQDLYPLALFRRHTRRPLPVLGPPGTRALLEQWIPLFSSHAPDMLATLRVQEVGPGEASEASGIVLRPFAVEHNAPAAYGWTATDASGGPGLVVSGDTRPCRGLEAAAAEADLLLCEATFAGSGSEASRAHHMTAAEAGALARRAKVRRLVLTHLLVTTDPDKARREAEDAFGGAVEVATAGSTFRIPGRA